MKRALWASLALLTVLTLTLWGASVRFYDDDPIQREPETRDASGVKSWSIDLTWDLAYNLFAHPGDPASNVRAQNINTIDEVPDSNWFTNRILARPVSIEEAVKGPLTDNGPAPPPWTIIRPKAAGAAPGFTMRDSNNVTWFISFDANDHPEAATSSIMVANKIFWTLGYWQVENHIISIQPGDLKIAETASMKLDNGKRRPMRQSDLDDVLRRSEQSPNGSFRAVAGKGLSGTILGGFKYSGTRPDDPNDVVPHEHRRELRALKVFGAWTNLVDMKAGNTLDATVTEGGKVVVRHYLQDVGSTFGTGALLPREYDEGWEYLFEGSPLLKRLVTFGFYLRPWQTTSYLEYPSIGRFEAEDFDPMEWKPRVPTAAFVRARADDNFWAARRVMAFSDDMIRAIVKTGRFSDAAAEKHLADTLIARRNKIGRTHLTAVNPLVNFAMDSSGTLTFTNAAVEAGVSTAPAIGYSAEWASFDNLTGQTQFLGNFGHSPGAPTKTAQLNLSPGPQPDSGFIRGRVTTISATDPAWASPITVYFRRVAGNWKLVGLER